MKIEKYLVLNKFMLSLFGIEDFKDFQQKLKDTALGYENDGRSYFYNVLFSSFPQRNKELLSDEILFRYDQNVSSYVEHIKSKRPGFNLKYFQYLAVLFTEILLDNLKNKEREFLYELNEFLHKYKKKNKIELEDFKAADLKKIAFWMATGSGKTLIMHINYLQFFHYNLFSPENILLITPNEGLSRQHFEEMEKSGIPCKFYSENIASIHSSDKEVLIIEITKLVEEKKGKGLTVSINNFEGRNLIFVDEGHKGKKSEEEKWTKIRNRLSENGLVFEYSATFGQILDERDKKTLAEYAKAIVFDYSYKYFYLDDYGKNFSVLNIKNLKTEENTFARIMFIANLLDYFEQLVLYEQNAKIASEYNLEKPLWIYVGTSVTAANVDKDKTDVEEIVGFFYKFIKGDTEFRDLMERLLNHNSGLKDDNGTDLFANKFKALNNIYTDNENGILSIDLLMDDIFKKIFGGKGALSFYEIKNAEGEIGLKVGENPYFGVINIGDVSQFKKRLENKSEYPVEIKIDAISDSLFDSIKKIDSSINVLIGSKKFIEGWDTWRVSSMGLLNVGKGEGPQIIQLFGRGIRIKGKDMTLKRGLRKDLAQLETLNIYGIQANYLNTFLDTLMKEEVILETYYLPIKFPHQDKWNSLYTIARADRNFEEEVFLNLDQITKDISITLNLSPIIEVSDSIFMDKEKSISDQDIKVKNTITSLINDKISKEFLNKFIDWDKIWIEIINYKAERGYWNLIINPEVIKKFIFSGNYKLVGLTENLEIKDKDDITRLEDIILQLLKQLIDRFYKNKQKEFEQYNSYYKTLDKESTFNMFKISDDSYGYTLQIEPYNQNSQDIIKKICNLIANLNNLSNSNRESILPLLYFDRHLYIPLLLNDPNIKKISPEGLVESEKQFVWGLIDFLNSSDCPLKNRNLEIYLLRNYPKSGVGFFNLHSFYPDFIMWIKEGEKQTIVFIDPKGLEHQKDILNEKIQLFQEIKNIEKKLGNNNIILESFILSITSYEDIIEGITEPKPKEFYIDNHVLFLEKNWQSQLFDALGYKV